MLSQVNTLTFSGINISDVQIQCQISSGMPSFNIVGLPDKIIAESKERVRAALHSIALELPAKRIVVNLSPADLMKEGSHFDLAIASCILIGMNILPREEMQKYLIIGELALDGNILPVNGALPAAIGANHRNLGLICPFFNGPEAAWSGNEDILAPKNLISMINHFKGIQILAAPKVKTPSAENIYPDLKDIIGQETAKRALEIAAAGGHNMLMIGSPGSGKSMLAQRINGILPPMNAEEILETSMIYSVAGEIKNGKLHQQRPFRAPHHSSSMVAMVGGGHSKKILPGEISLATNGILFLDEFPEFPRNVIESLRQPLENKKIMISRANSSVFYPAKFQLIAAMNHCKCGNFTNANKTCNKAPRCAIDYQNKVSGPILDRIDIIIEVNGQPKYPLEPTSNNETSQIIAKRVASSREIQMERYSNHLIMTNSELDGDLLYKYAAPDAQATKLLQKFAKKNNISMRSYNKIIKVARTIADMEKSTAIEEKHIAETLSYRGI